MNPTLFDNNWKKSKCINFIFGDERKKGLKIKQSIFYFFIKIK
jgi:hypothetical protein